MKNLESLFVEFNCSTVESLLAIINNQIDWYNEMLYDDPWNTWAQASLNRLKQLETEIEHQFVLHGADNDIDLHR